MKEDTINDMKTAVIMEKDSEIASIMSENQNLTSVVADQKARYEKLSEAFESVSKHHKDSENENWQIKVN